ncbi:hypothetical protein L195_g055227, partial [Trifolium pratense]
LRPRGPDSASLDRPGWPTIREHRMNGRHPNGHIPGTYVTSKSTGMMSINCSSRLSSRFPAGT